MSIYDNDENKPILNWVDTNLLQVDNTYQRSTEGKRSQNIIKLIINNFDWNEFAPLVVAKTPEGYAIIGWAGNMTMSNAQLQGVLVNA